MPDFPTSLISSTQLTPAIVARVLSLAAEMHKICDAKQRIDLLGDKIVALIFLEPSSRTMLSFQAAAQRLQAGVLFMQGKEHTSFAKGETLADTMKLITGYADLIVARLPETGSAVGAAAACGVPFINAGDGANEHPTQALIDAYTIWRELGTLEGLHIACGFDPKHSRSIHSLVTLLSQYQGNRFTFVSPEPLRAANKMLDMLRDGTVAFSESSDMAALQTADVLYLNRLQAERFTDDATFDTYRHLYCLKPDMLTAANRLILDPLPRVDEIDVAVDDLPVAAYFRQAHNGVPVRMALLSLMLGRDL